MNTKKVNNRVKSLYALPVAAMMFVALDTTWLKDTTIYF